MRRPRPHLALVLLGLGSLSTSLVAARHDLRVTRFDRISVADGLSASLVWAIHQDARGFMWFGTNRGLDRYDGYDFKLFKPDPEDPDSLAGSTVFAIHEDRHGVLWVGTTGGGLNAYHPSEDRFEHFRSDPADPRSLSHDRVRTIFEDRAGTLWIGTAHGLNRFQRGEKNFIRYLHDPADAGSLGSQSITAIHEDRAGRLWIGGDRGLDLFAPQRETFDHYRHDPGNPESLGHDMVFAIAEDPGGGLWIGTSEGLDLFAPETGSFTHYRHQPADPRSLPQGRVEDLHVDRKGTLWIATGDGLACFDRASDRFVRHRHHPADPQSMSSNVVACICEDRSGNVWLGTVAGVNKYVPSREQFALYRHQPGREETLSGSSIGAVLADRSGELWVGTLGQGLNRLDAARRSVVVYEPQPGVAGRLANGVILALHQDRSGTLWVGTVAGLARFDRDQERFVTYRHHPDDPESLSSGLVYSIHEDRSGRLWVGTDNGLNRFDRIHQRFIRYPPAPGDPPRRAFYAICEGPSGNLWFGSAPGGVYQLAPGGEEFRRFRPDPSNPKSLSDDRVGGLYEDRSGVLWIGTMEGGLNRFDPARGEFVHYRERDGLPSDSVGRIVGDDQGRLWLLTTNGLSRFDPQLGTFTNYGLADGLASNDFPGIFASRSPGGEIFVGGAMGLTAFFPDQITSDPDPPPVVVTEFSLFNQPVPRRREDPSSPLTRSILDTEELILTHRQYDFSFEFSALHYAKPLRNRFAHRLEGYDPDWVVTDPSKRFAHYSNLPPGEYVFRVKAANGDGVWNEQGRSIRIVVLPPPWKSWWAYTLYGLAAVALVSGSIRAQRRKLVRERASAEHERRIGAQLREANTAKDDLLAERERLIRELRARNAELTQINYTLSHDLRNPLVTIKSFLELVARDAADGDAQRLAADLGRIRAAADHLQQLVAELFEYSRLSHQPMAPEEVPLGELVAEVLGLLANRISQRGVRVEVARDLPPIRGHRPQLRELFKVLLENAIKFLGDQATPCVEVRARREDGVTVISVRDNGIGIEPRHHEKIFALFDRLDPEGEGTGIGLALARRIVELHGGRIWVESAGAGCGSTFWVRLPGDPGARAEATP